MAAVPTPFVKKPAEPNLLQVASFVAIFVVVANVMFYVLSWMYFDDKANSASMMLDPVDGSHETAVRVQFAIFSVVVGMASFLAGFSPRLVGHAIPTLVGVGTLVAAGAAYMKDLPMVLPITLLLLGVFMPVLAWKSLQRVRGAWAFLLAICMVFATCLFFGAPKVRGLLHVNLWTALIIPGILVVASISLNLISDDYKE
jgi:hypothetical protein